MEDLGILQQRNPEAARFVEQWREKYQRVFDLSSEAERANFYEAMIEMARHIALASTEVRLHASVNTDGVTQLSAMSIPMNPSAGIQ